MLPPEDNQQSPGEDPRPPGFLGPETHCQSDPGDTLDEEPMEETDEDEFGEWKENLRREFDRWLDELDRIPDPEPGESAPETPDLYSFYAQWAAANTEARKGNRRTAEAFSQWGDALGRFEGDLGLLREQLQRLQADAPTKGLSQAHCLVLVELLDRLRRVAGAFASPPPSSWWAGTARWRQAWESQHQAFDILLGHFDSLLKKEGVARIETAGQAFDASRMAAVAAEPDDTRPDQTILEEVAPGYLLRGELLRPAQVKVSINKPSNSSRS